MMRTKAIQVVDRVSTISGPSTPQFVTLPAAPWEQADSEREIGAWKVGSMVTIFGTTFVNATRAAKDLKVDRTGLANACLFGRLDQYIEGQLARERSNVRTNKTFTALYEKSLKRQSRSAD
jgi:hypothetical protein